MKVQKAIIKNFMPFYKEVPVDLQTSSDSPLILMGGKNDRGKTAFFTAMRFCLYGFEGGNAEKSKKRRQAINRKAAKEGLGEASVTLEFTHNQNVYEIERVIEFDQVDDPDERDWNSCYVNVKKPSVSEGKETVIDQAPNEDPAKKYNRFINGILPESASDFFFFDGEELDRYAGSYNDSEADVREAIETVLGIREIQNAIHDLKDEGKDYYQDEWKNKAEDVEELQGLSEDISSVQSDIEAKKTEKNSAKTKLRKKEKRRSQIEDDLAEASGVAGKQDRVNEIKEEIEGKGQDDGLKHDLDEKRGERRELHSRLGPLMIGIGAKHAIDNYDVSIVSGMEDTIEYLLDRDDCLCGADIDEDAEETLENTLEQLRNDEMSTISELQGFASDHLDCLTSGDYPENLNVNQAKSEYVSIQEDIEGLEEDINDLEDEKETLEGEIEEATVTAEEAESLRDTKETLDEEIGGLKTTIKDLDEKIDELEEQKRELEQTVNSMEAADEEEQRYRTLMKLSDECADAWEEIRDRYVETQRESVEKHASKIFQELTNKNDVYEGLTISKDYELDVKTISGDRDIEEQNPSKGARQIIAYSFIAGLNKFTAREAPVVIDTPIGRLDPEHKENLIDYFPNFRDQVIILYQPGEIDEEDIEQMGDNISSHLEIHQRDDDPESSEVSPIESETELRRVLAK
ncbi:AAA family ATPase [Haloarcula brevis]|uniref:AAA family ATPase n=1 Tax=Haloarcula brevis TaxID=3111453 RepID=UPI00300EACA8